MLKQLRKTVIYLVLIPLMPMLSQEATCNGLLPFEEKEGLLTIEMESGVINDNRWKIGTETETINGENRDTNYLYWSGSESFNSLSNAPIVYNVKINNPGTYRFAWRMKVGLGISKGEHNDAWLKIDAEDFYGVKNGAKVYPKPYCNSSDDLTCAAGTSTDNFIKAFGNTLDWVFVTNTNDHVAHRVFVTFNEAKEYTITVDARSSNLFIDKMVLRKNGISDSSAFDLDNEASSCYEALSVDAQKIKEIKIFPNPTKAKLALANLPLNSNLIISNAYGAVLKKLTTSNASETIDMTNFPNGIYFISSTDRDVHFFKKIIKYE
ncbi:T9SS type A sorting domain-containing protein [Flavicella sediminum]|uniref:T9SS type A sorting domain-containing protein n=1 Tax=Flavicella sediminum TaxID=2585141 RepID=UPI00111F366E|nr:T9SS type A sorting domain-containing protein [Flavicella sediminum]